MKGAGMSKKAKMSKPMGKPKMSNPFMMGIIKKNIGPMKKKKK